MAFFVSKELLTAMGTLVVISDTPDELANMFLRVQEYRESPDSRFRGRAFNLDDYIEYYTQKTGAWTYPEDYTGYNLPSDSAISFFSDAFEGGYTLNDEEKLLKTLIRDYDPDYLISHVLRDGSTGLHEIAHAIYHHSTSYKKIALAILYDYPEFVTLLSSRLVDLEYCSDVIKDEVQAYCISGAEDILSQYDIRTLISIRTDLLTALRWTIPTSILKSSEYTKIELLSDKVVEVSSG